ncbi:MAG: DNA methyltransferase [Acidobacteria bacterium]|nr:DNA methyltransferase [Acidobacteriota bacterium]
MAKGNRSPKSSDPRDILEVAYQSALDNRETLFVASAGLVDDVEFVCRCSNQAGSRFLMACLLAKLSNPSFDLRKPYTEIGGKGTYSGRYFDEMYIAPFAFKYKLPVNPTTSFLTPAFRTNKSLIAPGVELIGRPKQLYEKAVKLITAAHKGSIRPDFLLMEILRWLIIVREERAQRIETLFASLKAVQTELFLPAESIVTLIQQHLALPKSSRLPVLVVAAAYQAARNRLGEQALPLQGHNAADSQTGALGDVQIVLRDENDVMTVYEMKAKRVLREDLEIAVQKLVLASRRVDNYIFITTDRIDESVKEFAATLHGKIGVEFVVLDCIGFLRHFLHLFYRVRMDFIEAYQNLLLAEPDSAVNPTLKEAFLSLRLATETGIAQAEHESE